MSDHLFRYSVSISIERMPHKTPFLLQGNLKESVDILKKCEYDAAELQIRNARSFREDWFLRCVEEGNFSVSAIGTGSEFTLNHLSLSSPDSYVRHKAIAHVKDHIDLAAAYRSDVIVGTMRGALAEGVGKEQYHAYIREALKELCAYALPKKVNLLLEAINFYVMDFYNSVAEASGMIDSVNAPNLKVHIDTHHMMIEEKDICQSIRECGNRVGYVHFSDNNRMYPGACAIDFTAIMQTLLEIGYTGYVALECLPVPDGVTGLRLGMENLKRFESLLRG
jgi:sugar phosphate isomerase/epimerase